MLETVNVIPSSRMLSNENVNVIVELIAFLLWRHYMNVILERDQKMADVNATHRAVNWAESNLVLVGAEELKQRSLPR
jgi:hypothetical protein